MQRQETERRARRTSGHRVLATAATLLCAWPWLGTLGPTALAQQSVGQTAINPRAIAAAPGSLVQFELTQSDKELGGSSNDQITVIFANRSVEGARPPVPFFSEDVVQEFSFSATNVTNGRVRFARRVRDKSFLETRFIRVVNHGSDGWAGDTISLTVDGEEILRAVSMWPRRGAIAAQKTRGGIEKFNPREWGARSYWEAELKPYRAAKK
jgi:hypothetical protein